MEAIKKAARIGAKRRRYLLAHLPQYCAKCGTTENLTLDHILARGLGGSNREANLQMLCWSCNQAKGRLEQDEAKARQRTEKKLQKAAGFREQARQARAMLTGKPTNYGGRAFSKR